MIDPSAPWLLDLFCCAGGAGVGYYRAGFNVIGVDIARQKRYPFTFVQADALAVLRGQIANLGIAKFAAVHASPPCQAHSDLQKQSKIVYEDFIGPTRELLEPLGIPYVIENVEGAPLIDPIKLCGASDEFPELRVIRHRLFESNIALRGTPCPKKHPLVFTFDKRKPHHATLNQDTAYVQVTGGGNCRVANKRDAMGTPWMTGKECNEAIPPAYTEFIGRQLLDHINSQEDSTTMSRTHRTHLATDDHAARRHTRRRLRTVEERQHKTAKACRAGERTQLRETRKEYR